MCSAIASVFQKLKKVGGTRNSDNHMLWDGTRQDVDEAMQEGPSDSDSDFPRSDSSADNAVWQQRQGSRGCAHSWVVHLRLRLQRVEGARRQVLLQQPLREPRAPLERQLALHGAGRGGASVQHPPRGPLEPATSIPDYAGCN